jgi:hypothetical protein
VLALAVLLAPETDTEIRVGAERRAESKSHGSWGRVVRRPRPVELIALFGATATDGFASSFPPTPIDRDGERRSASINAPYPDCVGKGARNRAKRERTAGARRGVGGGRLSRRELARAIFDVDSVKQFRALLAADPRLLEEATIRELDGPQYAAGYAEQFARKQALLREARDDPDAAWERHQSWFAEAQRAGDELERLVRLAESAYDAARFDDALVRADEALPLAERYGLGAVAYVLHALRGRTLLRRGGDRGANVDAAIDALEQALRHSLAGDDAAYVLDLLGAAHAQRPRGDHAENIENAIAAQRQGLAELGPTSAPDILALARTNLAATLLARIVR